MKRSILALSLTLALARSAYCQVSFGGGLSYSQNFDTLANTGTSVSWSQNSTLSGWFLFISTGAAAPNYDTGTGSSSTGKFYSFGSASASDRAFGGVASGGAYFGSPASGALAGYIAVGLQNTSGSTLDSFTISYDGEQWRDGGANGGTPAAQTMVLQYGFGATFAGVTTWNAAGSSFNFTSPVFVNTTTGAAVDGNVAGKSADRGGTISSLTWNDGDTLWVRWVENNDAGNDHGLAVDNFSITATVAPEPTVVSLTAIGLLGLLIRRRK